MEYKGIIHPSIPKTLGVSDNDLYELIITEMGKQTHIKIVGKNLANEIEELGYEGDKGIIRGPM
jgi:hypothetical protein